MKGNANQGKKDEGRNEGKYRGTKRRTLIKRNEGIKGR